MSLYVYVQKAGRPGKKVWSLPSNLGDPEEIHEAERKLGPI
jgi:hypothetical protein